MIKVELKFPFYSDCPLFKKPLYLFSVDASLSQNEEVRQAIYGEVNFNGAFYDLGGLIYPDRVQKGKNSQLKVVNRQVL